VNAARAKRRWLAWCRYTQKTGSTRSDGMAHYGAAMAFDNHVRAGRAYPRGIRSPFFPKWGSW
jgi:hypothetical protein